MKKPLTYSVVFHAVLVLLAIFGLPHILQPDNISEPVPIEIMTNAQIAELTTTNKPPVKAPPKEEPKKEEPPPPKKAEQPPPPKQTSTPPPPDEALKAPPKEEPKKEEPKKEPPKKPEKKPPPKKEEPKKDDQESEMDKLLKNLAPSTDVPQPDTPEPTKEKAAPEPSPDVSRFSDVLTMSEKDAMSSHYTPCWNVMAGSSDAQNLAVEVRFTVTPQNTLANGKVLNQGRYMTDPTFRSAADAAIRATQNPRCSSLPPFMSKYSGQTIVINFDPKDMF
jgi:hypothetical protein